MERADLIGYWARRGRPAPARRTAEPRRRHAAAHPDPAPDEEAELRHARERVLQAGIGRLDAFCSERSCPVAVHRLRQRHRELLREEIAQTVAPPTGLEQEVRYVVSVLGS